MSEIEESEVKAPWVDRDAQEAQEHTVERPPTLPEVVWSAARWIARRELLVRLAMVAVLLGLGVAGTVLAAGELEKREVRLTAPFERFNAAIDSRVTKLEQAEVARLEREAARDRITMETNLNVRLFLESQKIKPIDVPRFAEPDAGR